MNAIELKSELVTIIQQIDDVNVLKALKVLLFSVSHSELNPISDFWDDLPDNIKTDIDEAIEESDNGVTTSHDVVMKHIAEKYQLAL